MTTGPTSQQPSRRPRIKTLALLAVAVAGVVVLWYFPFYAPNDSVILTFSSIFMWVILATSWNLISGFTGYVDFGHAVHFGIGGYVTGYLMTRYDMGFLSTLPLAAVVCAGFAGVIGWPLLRLRGVYFSIAMLGAFLAVRQFAFLWTDVTNGARGLILPPLVDRNYFYYMFLAGAVISLAGVMWLRRSQLGASLLAIRDDEKGAEARGINTTVLKLIAFTVSAGVTGAVGSFFAYQATFVDPNIMFRSDFLITLAVMATLGGLGTTWGPAVGAVVYQVVKNTLWANDSSGSFLIYFGLVLMALVLFMPEGIAGTLERGERTQLGRQIISVRRRWFGLQDHRSYAEPTPDQRTEAA
jgi:branched-chain amino acid transport system permease protein